ncbi:MAG: glycosyltransferase family 1 protein [Candidatus Andersenbacteria bacterium]|nr:glycosyltransferase family 1 protein [bacterium]MDZ4225362.1 glycosyltransferase family 1 protein [Candidatus Andersenbacteria bacterium]
MRIAIDARAFSWAGIGRYTRNIIAGLARCEDNHKYVALVSAPDAEAFKRFAAEFPKGKVEMKLVDGSYYSWREQTVFWRQLAGVRADLWHFTHFNVPVFFRGPYVVTVHDVTRFIFPGQRRQGLKQQIAYEYVFKRAIEGARAIIAVSQATKEALNFLPLQMSDKTTVIYEGVDESFWRPVTGEERQKARLLIGTNKPYLLFVGVWMSHKNLDRLIRAFGLLIKKGFDYKLVITGRPKAGWGKVLKLTRTLSLEQKVIFPGYVPQKLLPAMYAEAACFVWPSLYEGFGLPVLEAAACGAPVVTSNVSSLPEVMGEAAIYVNPESVVDIAAGVERVMNDDRLRARLTDEGRARAQFFKWDKAVEQHLKVYEEATGKR